MCRVLLIVKERRVKRGGRRKKGGRFVVWLNFGEKFERTPSTRRFGERVDLG